MDIADLLKAALGVLTGALGTYLGLYWKIREELVAKYDQELRAERTKHYASLWQITEPLARYAPPSPVSYSVLSSLAKRLRQWYFNEGGMFMTDRARDAYFALQKSIAAVETPTESIDSTGRVPNDAEITIREKSSRLRTVLTADIGSRKKPLVDQSSEA